MMGNIHHIGCDRAVSHEEFIATLRDLLHERFGDAVVVEDYSEEWEGGLWVGVSDDYLKNNGWEQDEPGYGFQEGRYGFEMWREEGQPCTYSFKIQTENWGNWFCYYVYSHMARELDGWLLDYDDSGEKWESDPDRWPTFREYTMDTIVGGAIRRWNAQKRLSDKVIGWLDLKASKDHAEWILDVTPDALLALD